MHFLFFFNDTATTEIYTLSLHDALPISCKFVGRKSAKQPITTNTHPRFIMAPFIFTGHFPSPSDKLTGDRKSTRLNSSHSQISYAVFCLKKKKPLQAARVALANYTHSHA